MLDDVILSVWQVNNVVNENSYICLPTPFSL